MRVLVGALALGLCVLAGSVSEATAAPVRQQGIDKPVEDVATALGKAIGVEILIDSTLRTERTSFKNLEVTPTTLEAALNRLVKTLPPGSAWARVYLPEPSAGRKYSGDALAEFVLAQAALFGRAGVSEPGKVELLGKQVPTEEAGAMIARLKLRPYYVISRGRQLAPTDERQERLAQDRAVLGLLMKQLGVTTMEQIPPGDYKVIAPGPDGNPRIMVVTVKW